MARVRTKIFADLCVRDVRGATLTEFLLAMAIIAVAAPVIYNQISRTSVAAIEIAAANKIVNTKNNVLNFVRMNQDAWPEVAQIRMDENDLEKISSDAIAGFIDKYTVRGATIADIYLAFDVGDAMRGARIAGHIGADAAVTGDDGIAYGANWAVAAPDFALGNVIYKISYDVNGDDMSKFLHRGTSGDDGLNTMQRNLNMGGRDAYNVGGAAATGVQANAATATFVNAETVDADAVYFSAGANMDGNSVAIGDMRVTGDIMGFRTIVADNLNGRGFTTAGRVIADRATIANTVNVSRDFTLKPEYTRTVSGFTAISAGTVMTTFLSADEMLFYERFGLTVSGELLMSTTAPIKIGNWTFPSTTPPRFVEFNLSRGTVPATPSLDEFGPIAISGWRDALPVGAIDSGEINGDM